LSNRTDAQTLIKLLRATTYIENSDKVLVDNLFEYLRNKVFTVENEDLC